MPHKAWLSALALAALLVGACSDDATSPPKPDVGATPDLVIDASPWIYDTGKPIDYKAPPSETPPNLATYITVVPPFDADYRVYDLGPIPGAPQGRYGGTMLKPGDSSKLLIAVYAEAANGQIWEVGLKRGKTGHILGLVGPAVKVADAPNVDANLIHVPGDAILYSTWNTNTLGVILAGQSTPAQTLSLAPLGVPTSISGIGVVPSSFAAPQAGTLKGVTWSECRWYSFAGNAFTPTQVLSISSTQAGASFTEGCGGFAYIPAGSPRFAQGGLMMAEWATTVSAFDVDAQGDPIPSTRKPFLTGLEGSWAAYFDQVSGDYLFPSWGRQPEDTIILVQGFVPPPPIN